MWKTLTKLFSLPLLLHLTACPPEAIEGCGDDTIQENLGEQCDGSNLGANSCETQGFSGGALFCDNQCRIVTLGCFNGPECGNGVEEGVEECDDGNTTGGDGCNGICLEEFCGDGLDNNGNSEACDDSNAINTDSCINCQSARCGDSFIQSGFEQCDDGNQLNTDSCTASCQPASCGDGFVQTGVETCDDENTTNGDGCAANCQIETPAGCGDGVLQAGEECDDDNATSGDGCSAACDIESCGDGTVQPGLNEQCDDGNTTSGDGCTNACRTEFCGDGVDNNGSAEGCDDGNQVNGDGCTNQCVDERCGDGIDNDGNNEQCDDGNQSNTDTCTNACQIPRCGDTFTQAGEQCDDGNQSNTDACRNTCQNAVCGDNFIRSGVEQCDDGNTTNGDGCSSACQTEGAVCGNGQIQAGEQCDDGNQVNTDACLNTCQNASCGDGFIRANPAEQCDDGNTANGDGCSSTCTTEILGGCSAPTIIGLGDTTGDTTGGQDINGAFLNDDATCFGEANGPEDVFQFTSSTSGTLTLLLTDEVGNNDQVLYVRSTCDVETSELGCADEGVDGDGEILSVAVTANTPVFIFVDGFFLSSDGPYSLTVEVSGGASCGNGLVEGAEQCDDGNTTPNDGCEADCSLICGGNSGAIRAALDTANGHCYLGFSDNVDWLTAEFACEDLDGTLAVITSAAENTLARKASILADDVWIGAEDTSVEGSFEWINGETFAFANFAAGQPDNDASTGANGDCLNILSGLNTWNDTNCDFDQFVDGFICEIAPAGGVGKLVINEVDYDQAGTDSTEFIELKNTGTAPVVLNDFAVVLVNGANTSLAQYARFDLGAAGASLAPGQFLVIANTAVVVPGGTLRLTATNDSMQNGAPDGIAIFQISTNQLIDALSYEGSITNASSDFGTGINLVEGSPFITADTGTGAQSICRFADGTDTNNAATDFKICTTLTPGAANQ